jgi:hypothetical protein
VSAALAALLPSAPPAIAAQVAAALDAELTAWGAIPPPADGGECIRLLSGAAGRRRGSSGRGGGDAPPPADAVARLRAPLRAALHRVCEGGDGRAGGPDAGDAATARLGDLAWAAGRWAEAARAYAAASAPLPPTPAAAARLSDCLARAGRPLPAAAVAQLVALEEGPAGGGDRAVRSLRGAAGLAAPPSELAPAAPALPGAPPPWWAVGGALEVSAGAARAAAAAAPLAVRADVGAGWGAAVWCPALLEAVAACAAEAGGGWSCADAAAVAALVARPLANPHNSGAAKAAWREAGRAALGRLLAAEAQGGW